MGDTDSSQGGISRASIVGLLTFLTVLVLSTLLDAVIRRLTGMTGTPTGLQASVAAILLVCGLAAGVVAFVVTLGPNTSPRSFSTD